MNACEKYYQAAREQLDNVFKTQRASIERAAAWLGDALAHDRWLYAFGTGHSRIPVEELFPRYGSFPGFNPIVELSMTFHTQVVGANGQRQAMFIERVEGLAGQILASYDLGPPDAMLVFSASGVTAVSIEMAIGARERGLPVVAVTSVASASAGTPSHSSGTRLLDHADVVVDLCTPPGDALIHVDGVDTPVSPGSTVAAVAIANEIKALTATALAERGLLPPVLTSAALVGAERSAELFDAAYAEHARRASRALRRE